MSDFLPVFSLAHFPSMLHVDRVGTCFPLFDARHVFNAQIKPKETYPMKASILALPAALLFAGAALADQRIDHTVTVTATVPVERFYVEPLGGNWMNDPQNMSYRPVDGTLEPIRKQLSVKSTSGAIKAKLMNAASMTSGANTIALNVSVGGKTLGTAAAGEIVASVDDAKNGTVIDFQVSAVKPAGAFVPGSYQGLVNVIFETPDPA